MDLEGTRRSMYHDASRVAWAPVHYPGLSAWKFQSGKEWIILLGRLLIRLAIPVVLILARK